MKTIFAFVKPPASLGDLLNGLGWRRPTPRRDRRQRRLRANAEIGQGVYQFNTGLWAWRPTHVLRCESYDSWETEIFTKVRDKLGPKGEFRRN